MIETLERHRDIKYMIMNILKKENIYCEETFGNDSNGDIKFNRNDKKEVIEVLDKYLKDKKYNSD